MSYLMHILKALSVWAVVAAQPLGLSVLIKELLKSTQSVRCVHRGCSNFGIRGRLDFPIWVTEYGE